MYRELAALIALSLPALAVAQPAIPPQVTSVVSGGHWQRDAESGTYRAVIVQDGWEHVWSRLFIEWVSEAKLRDEAQKVIARVEPVLPFPQGTHVLKAQEIRDQSGRVVLYVSAWSNMRVGAKPLQFRVELAGPGQFNVIAPKGR
jgi:hypothetical protein